MRIVPRLASTRFLLAGVAGAVVVYAVEQVAPPGTARNALASLGLLGFSLGALFGTARAAKLAPPAQRTPWLFLAAGVVAWTLGLAVRSAALVAEADIAASNADLGALAAAPLFALGVLSFLRGQRLAFYALVLDAGVTVLLLFAAVALFLGDVIARLMTVQPVSTTAVLLYAMLYAAAAGAAVSVLFGLPLDVPRRAFLALVAGIGIHALAFTLALPRYLTSRLSIGSVLDLLWMLGMLGIAVSGRMWLEDRETGGPRMFSRTILQLARMALPAAMAVVGAALIVATGVYDIRSTELVVDMTVAAIIVLLSVRAGLALYGNWRLGMHQARRARQFEALFDVGLAAARERSLDELVRLVVKQATALTISDGAMLALAERDGTFVIRALFKGRLLQLRDSVGEPLRGISLAAVSTLDLVVATSYRDHPASTPELHDVISSAVAMPLIAHGELIGTLATYSAAPRRYSLETERLIRLYAAQAAAAISNTRLLEETHRLARDDDLTGALNRRSLMERLTLELHGATRHGDEFAVVLCDVDGLKAVNDTAGHLAGNAVLVTVGRVLRESVRQEDVVARFGGDEFVLVLPRTGALQAQALVARMAARLRDETYHWAGRDQPLPRVSFGIAHFPADGRTEDALLAVADERMYADKGASPRARDAATEAE